MKDKRMFIGSSRGSDNKSSIFYEGPQREYVQEHEVTMRDCSRQIHWMFSNTKAGLAKAKKVAAFFNELQAEIESKVNKEKKND